MSRHLALRAFLFVLLGCGWLPAWARPAATVAPAGPPDLEAVLLRAVELARQDLEREARFKARYAYVRTKVTETLSADGAVRKRENHRIEHSPDRPEPGEPPTGEAGSAEASTAKRAYERRDIQVTPEMLRRFRFTAAGREDLAGRPAWVVDFTPAGDRQPTHNLIEKFINRTAGRVWIDEADGCVARARFRLVGPVNVVGGLVGALKHCEVDFERVRTPDGLWYTRLLTWRIEGRKLFSRRIMEHRDEVTEVRRAAPAQEAPGEVAATQ